MVMCFVPDCKHYSERDTCRYYAFPKDQKEAKKWITALRKAISNNKQYSQNWKCSLEQLEQMELKHFKEEKLRQRIRESSMELRELETKLRAAYTAKELAAQLAEREAAKLEEKLQKQASSEYMKTVYANERVLEQERKLEDLKRKYEYRTELQNQMLYTEQQKQAAYEEFLRDRKLIDEIAQRIMEEDQREREEELIKMKKTKEEMDAFYQAREIRKQKEQEAVEEENRRLLKYIEEKMAAEQKQMQEVKDQRIKKEEIVSRIGRQLYDAKKLQQEEEEARLSLETEEQKLKAQKRELSELERCIRHRLACQEAEHFARKERKRQLEDEAKREAEYKEKLLQVFAENEKLEQMSAQKRRMKILEYRRTIEQMIADRRQRREQEIKELHHLEKLHAEQEQQRKQIIEEERLNLLKEHATKLLGYLPPGVLQKDDLPHLGSEFVKKYESLKL